MKADDVTLGKKRIEIDAARVAVVVATVVEDFHFKGPGDMPHRPADPAMPDDPERQPGKLDEVAVPVTKVWAGSPAPFMD